MGPGLQNWAIVRNISAYVHPELTHVLALDVYVPLQAGKNSPAAWASRPSLPGTRETWKQHALLLRSDYFASPLFQTDGSLGAIDFPVVPVAPGVDDRTDGTQTKHWHSR